MKFFTSRRAVISGAIIALVGLLLLIEGIWLISTGGTWFYALSGLGYLGVGALLIMGRRAALWLNALILLGSIIWAFVETGFGPYAVYALLPRLEVTIIVSIYLMMPWVWRPLGTNQRGRDTAAIGLVPGAVGVLLLAAALVAAYGTSHIQAGPAYAQAGKPTAGFSVPDFGVAPGNWPSYGRTPGGSRYSPLAQITPKNVNQLKVAWTYRSGDYTFASPGPPHVGGEATPIKIGNTVYTCTPAAWVVALDATTGKQLWKFKPRGIDQKAGNFANCRGVSYYKAPASYEAADGSQTCAERIIAPTMGPFVAALDAKTGKLCPDFGDHGMIDLKQNMGTVAPGTLVQSSAPLVMNGKIYTGGNVMDNWFLGEPSGVVRAFDAITGKEAWHWDLGKADPTAPLTAGEIFTPYTPNAWGPITGDPDAHMIYVPLGNATPDYYGKNRRPFDMKYSGSIVALNTDTGKEVWHFQESHTDVWDYDIPTGPAVINWSDGHGGSIPAVLSTNKRGQLFVLNRMTGKPILPVVEQPSPQGPKDSVMHDWISKTQPISPAIHQFTPARLHASDMWGATPFDQMWCRAKFNQLVYEGNATPPTLQGSLMYPTFDGVTDWYGASVTPGGKLNIVSNYLPFVGKLIPRDEAAGKGLIKTWNGKGTPPIFRGQGSYNPQYGLPYAIKLHPFLSSIGAPCIQPPWAELAQVDLGSGKIEWIRNLGDTRHTGPWNTHWNIPLPTGIPSLGSGVVTASGVVFISGTADQMMRAFDEHTGKLLWSYELPAGAQATPSVYKGADGREYVVITAAGHQPLKTKLGDYTIAFALPKAAATH